jgi:hypothetical protein
VLDDVDENIFNFLYDMGNVIQGEKLSLADRNRHKNKIFCQQYCAQKGFSLCFHFT